MAEVQRVSDIEEEVEGDGHISSSAEDPSDTEREDDPVLVATENPWANWTASQQKSSKKDEE